MAFRSPNAGQTALTLQHATSPRSGYKPPPGHNADGYTMAERVTMAKAKGLYANIHAKKKRIAAGSGEKMRKPGAKGAPTAANFKRAAKTAKKS